MDNKVIKQLSRNAIVILLILLLLEFIVFSIFLSFQPTRQQVVVDTIGGYKHSNGYGYQEADLGSTFYSISSLTMLGESIPATDANQIRSFVLSQQDTATGLFRNLAGKISVEATYYAIGTLNQLGDPSSIINSTQVKSSLLDLKTSNGLFREYGPGDEVHQVYGDTEIFFQAVSVLQKLTLNTTDFYLALNRTQIAQTLSVLQAADGSVNKGYFQNEYTMKNAYHVSSLLDKLNVSLGFFDTYGFSTNRLINWIDQMYTHDGFRMTAVSKPTPEATAYALIALNRLGIPNENITQQYADGLGEMVHEIVGKLEHDADPIDTIHDILLSVSITNNLDLLQNKTVSKGFEDAFGILIGLTSFLLFAAFITSSLQTLREDDSEYFDTALSLLIPEVLDDTTTGKTKLSKLLGLKIDRLVLIEHSKSTRGTFRLHTKEYEFLITFTFETWDPLELTMVRSGSTKELLNLQFYESDLIPVIQQKIKDAISEDQHSEA